MRQERSIGLLRVCLRLGAFLILCPTAPQAQRVAIVTPEKSKHTDRLTARLSEEALSRLNVLDPEMVESAFGSIYIEAPFNMTADDAKRAAATIGSDYLLLIRSGTLRRTSFAKGDYYESFAVTFLVSGRTGKLVDWRIASYESKSPEAAEKMLLDSVKDLATVLVAKIMQTKDREMREQAIPSTEQVLPEKSTADRGVRPPLPYRRLKPDYPQTAYLYNVRATIDAEAEIAADGSVHRVNVIRWAGYGLDESVIETIREMKWRPAERNGKPLPMRVLLRYNFTKIEKEPY